MKILAFDPGKNDFAFAAINQKARVCDHGFVRSITTMTPTTLRDEITRFLVDIDKLLDKHEPELVVIERMQHRPHLGGGAVVEYINVMIGMAVAKIFARGCGITLVSASTWKSHMKKIHGIGPKDLFTMVGQKMTVKLKPDPTDPKAHKTKLVVVPGILDKQLEDRGIEIKTHEGDAIGLACYGWWQITKIDIVGHVI